MPLTNPASTGGATPDVWLPPNQGFLAQSCDPALATSNTSLTNGVLRTARIPIQTAKTITNLVAYVAGVGATLTGAIGLLYKLDGTLIARTASQNTAWAAAAGLKTMPLSPEAGQSLSLPAADVIGALMVITASSGPTLFTTPQVGDSAILGLASPAFRGGFLTGQGAVPTTLSGVSSASSFAWMALS